ncbi:hypothetical protein [Mycoplasmopsis pulmonis]|nr:hypothetical protein [Mycoplasmopsis pulmonis]
MNKIKTFLEIGDFEISLFSYFKFSDSSEPVLILSKSCPILEKELDELKPFFLDYKNEFFKLTKTQLEILDISLRGESFEHKYQNFEIHEKIINKNVTKSLIEIIIKKAESRFKNLYPNRYLIAINPMSYIIEKENGEQKVYDTPLFQESKIASLKLRASVESISDIKINLFINFLKNINIKVNKIQNYDSLVSEAISKDSENEFVNVHVDEIWTIISIRKNNKLIFSKRLKNGYKHLLNILKKSHVLLKMEHKDVEKYFELINAYSNSYLDQNNKATLLTNPNIDPKRILDYVNYFFKKFFNEIKIKIDEILSKFKIKLDNLIFTGKFQNLNILKHYFKVDLGDFNVSEFDWNLYEHANFNHYSLIGFSKLNYPHFEDDGKTYTLPNIFYQNFSYNKQEEYNDSKFIN